MDTEYLDGAEGLVITVFLSHIVYHFLSSDIITNGKSQTQTMMWTPYVEVLNVIGGIRVFHWSKLGLSDKLRIFSQRIIYYQITHLIFIALNTQLPGNVYFPTFSNMLLVQCFSRLRYDMYDLSAVYSQVFQNYNIIFLFSKLLRSNNGLIYQLCIIFLIILFRCFYVVQRIQTDDFIYYPQQFLSQGWQETISAFLTFLGISLFEKMPETNKLKSRKFLIIAIILNLQIIHMTLKPFYKLSNITFLKQQWVKFTLGYIFLRPIYILEIIILFFLINLSTTIRTVFSHPVFSKLFYLPRMYQIFMTCIVQKVLLGNLSHMQIGPADPVILGFIVVGFMAVVQFFSILAFYLFTPLILAVLIYFDVLCDYFSAKIQEVVCSFNAI